MEEEFLADSTCGVMLANPPEPSLPSAAAGLRGRLYPRRCHDHWCCHIAVADHSASATACVAVTHGNALVGGRDVGLTELPACCLVICRYRTRRQVVSCCGCRERARMNCVKRRGLRAGGPDRPGRGRKQGCDRRRQSRRGPRPLPVAWAAAGGPRLNVEPRTEVRCCRVQHSGAAITNDTCHRPDSGRSNDHYVMGRRHRMSMYYRLRRRPLLLLSDNAGNAGLPTVIPHLTRRAPAAAPAPRPPCLTGRRYAALGGLVIRWTIYPGTAARWPPRWRPARCGPGDKCSAKGST